MVNKIVLTSTDGFNTLYINDVPVLATHGIDPVIKTIENFMYADAEHRQEQKELQEDLLKENGLK